MPDLGKYGFDVIGSYGVTIVLVLLLVLYVWRRSVRVKKALREVEERQKAGRHG